MVEKAMSPLTQVQLPAHRPTLSRSSRPITLARAFYPAIGILLTIIAFIGFSRFFLHGLAYPGRPIAPPIRTLIFAHAITFSAWMLLIITQPMLIMLRHHRWHMMIGKVGSILALAIIILGTLTAIRSAAITPPEVTPWPPLTPMKFMAIPLGGILLFTIFIALGIIYRRKPAVHRSMMMLGTIAALSAAFARIDPLNNLFLGSIFDRLFGPFFFTIIIGLIMLAARSAIIRRVDAPFAIGLASLTLGCFAIMQIAPTAAWENFARTLAG